MNTKDIEIPDRWIECPPTEAEKFFDQVNGVLREFTETDYQYIVRVGIDVEVDCYKNQTQYWKFTPVKKAPLLQASARGTVCFDGFNYTYRLLLSEEWNGKTVEVTVKEVRE